MIFQVPFSGKKPATLYFTDGISIIFGNEHTSGSSYESNLLERLRISLARIEEYAKRIDHLHDILNMYRNDYLGCHIKLTEANIKLLHTLSEEASSFNIEQKDLKTIKETLQTMVNNNRTFDDNSRLIIMNTLRQLEWRLNDMFSKFHQVYYICYLGNNTAES